MSRIAGLFRSLPFALLAFALILSSAAWGAHSVTHGLALAAAGAPAGAKHAAAPAPDREAPDQDRQDGGHDHFLGLSFPVAALFEGWDLQPPPFPAAELPVAEVATLALRAPDPPPADPPRTA